MQYLKVKADWENSTEQLIELDDGRAGLSVDERRNQYLDLKNNGSG